MLCNKLFNKLRNRLRNRLHSYTMLIVCQQNLKRYLAVLNKKTVTVRTFLEQILTNDNTPEKVLSFAC